MRHSRSQNTSPLFLAPRPAYSVLGSERGVLILFLEDAINRYFHERDVFYMERVAKVSGLRIGWNPTQLNLKD